jgi:Ca-activated chloride channel family protein
MKAIQKKSTFSVIGLLSVMAFAALIFVGSSRVQAAGLLVADGGFGGILEIKSHDVNVTINNGIAVTRVTQVFFNTENRQVEALFTFPVPKGASVADFSMWINGKEMVGEVLEKKRARQIYNSYKRKRRDPGLLEQVDYKTFEMRIFPIAARADQKVEIIYYQELNVDHDQATYVYPLATVTRKDINARTSGKFSIQVEVKSAVPITKMVSPSHPNEFVISRHTGQYAVASLETAGGDLASDVVINYDLARAHTGMDLITSRQQGEDGYFCLTLSTGASLEKHDLGMDYVFLLDISGSMRNDGKLIVSKNAVAAFIDELDAKDRFELMTFNIDPITLFNTLRPADSAAKESAKAHLDTRSARGGTVLAPAMTTAYKYGNPDRTLNVIILSDGMTQQNERQILMQLINERPGHARVFCIGVGNEVNRPLLEQMAHDSGGLAAFISRGDNFKRQAKAFRRKLMRPAATNVTFDLAAIGAYAVVPEKLPNLYHGTPIRIYGRYKNSGENEIRLTADIEGKAISENAILMFPEEDRLNPEIERMWALKRVDQLFKPLNRTQSNPQIIDEIIGLGETYSIVTEYTSFLVLENDAEYKRWQIERRNARRLERDRDAQNKRKKLLDAIRTKAQADIGPQPEKTANQIAAKKAAIKPVSLPVSATQPASTPVNRTEVAQKRPQSRDFSFGTGPVGPLFMGLALWLRRKKAGK